MAWGEGQIVGLLTAGITGCVGAVGVLASRYGTFQSRQTEIEKNLLAQITLNATRIDAMDRDRAALEAGFRTQIMALERERRESEHHFREVISRQDIEIDQLKDLNSALKHENWILKNRPIGGDETPLPKPQIGP